VDGAVPMLVKMFEKRMKGIETMGYLNSAPETAIVSS
jgi:hypothetical protein